MKYLAPLCLAPLLTVAIPLNAQAGRAPAVATPASPRPTMDAERVRLAREFVALTFKPEELIATMRESIDRSAEAMSATLDAAFGEPESEKPATDHASLDRFLELALPRYRQHIPALGDAYAQAYAREFTEAELQQMVAFARSPGGAHFLSRQTAIDFSPEVSDVNNRIMREMSPIMQQWRQEMCAKKTQARIAAGDTKARCPLEDEGNAAS